MTGFESIHHVDADRPIVQPHSESDRLKVAHDDAVRSWPGVKSRAQFLVRLAEAGRDVLLGTVSQSTAAC